MPGIGAIVSAISADVSAALAAAGYAPLTDGGILIGRQHIKEMSSPPKIVFVPRGSTFNPRDFYNRSNVEGAPSAEMKLQWAERAVHTDLTRFDVHCWGVASPPDPEGGDFDATQVLYQAVIQSVRRLAYGSYNLLPGTWLDQAEGMGQLQKLGHWFVFGIEFQTPILDMLLSYVPSGTVGEVTVEYAGNSTEGIVIIV